MNIRKYWNGWTALTAVILFAAVYSLLLYPWMMQWGATGAEAAEPLPGDELVPVAASQSTRAVTVNAPAPVVWQWLVQLGQDRAGFYSNDWLENLTLADIHNGDLIRPEWQSRNPGEMVLGAGGKIYGDSYGWRIRRLEAGRLLYLWGSIVVQPIDAGSSRLITRTRTPPAPMVASFTSMLTYDWMHFVMERGMLLGIKARAEGRPSSDPASALFSGIGWIAATAGILGYLVIRRSIWLLLPLVYAAAILSFTHDIWSAMAGFLWWGIIIAGFVAFGRRWWNGLAPLIPLVILVFVLASYPQTAFGILFLAAMLFISLPPLFTRWRARSVISDHASSG